MSTDRSNLVNIFAVIPYFFLTILWLVPSILVCIAFLSLVIPALPTHFQVFTIFPLFAVLFAIELIKRNAEVAARGFRLLFTVYKSVGVILSKTVRLLPFAIMAALATYAVVRGLQGYQSPRGLDPGPGGSTLLSAILTFTTAYIAVFIAGQALLAELLSSPYTSGLRVPFTRHPIFLISLFSAVAVTAFCLLLLRYGWNDDLLQASLAIGLMLVVSLPPLFNLFMSYTKIPRLIDSYTSRQVLPFISRSIRKATPLSQPPESKSAQGRLNLDAIALLLRLHLLGQFPASEQLFPPLSVSSEVVGRLREQLRPIFNVCSRAIREDRRDVLLAGVSSLKQIAGTYIDARRNYPSADDDFLAFLATEIDLLFSLALTVRNQQYTADLVDLTTGIALETLALSEGQLDPDSNGSAFIYGKKLTEMATWAAELKNTTAAPDAIDGAGTLAVALMKQGTLNTAVYGVAESITNASRTIASAQGLWPAILTQHGLHALVKALWVAIDVHVDRQHIQDIYPQFVSDSLIEVLRAALSIDRDVISLNNITGPIAGPIWRSGNLVDLEAHVLDRLVNLPANQRILAISLLRHVVRVIGFGAVSSLQKDHAEDYAQALSEISWLSIVGITESTDEDTSQSLAQHLESILDTVHKILAEYLASPDSRSFRLLHRLSPIYALLMIYSVDQEDGPFKQLVPNSLEALLESYVNAELPDDNLNRARLRRYLMLFGAWYHARYPDEALAYDIAEAVAGDVFEADHTYYSSFRGELDHLGYPNDFAGDGWSIFPSRIWSSKEKIEAERTLNNLHDYRKFREIVESFFPEDESSSPESNRGHPA